MKFKGLIESLSNGRIYFGQTKDLGSRLKLHNEGKVRSTKKDAPWAVIVTKRFSTRSEAMWTERRLKRSHDFQALWLSNQDADNNWADEK